MISVVSFDGTAINDGITYEAGLPGDADAFMRSAAPKVLDVIGGFPRYEGADPEPVQFPVEITLLAVSKTNIDALNRLFRPGHEGEFAISWDGETRVRDCAVVSIHPMSGSANVYVVMLLAADSRWRSASVQSEDASITTTGQQFTVNNAGSAIEDKPVITITPVTQKAAANAWLYRRYAVVANRADQALTDWPIDITNYLSTGPSGGLDHAALVTAGKSQADGDDVRVLLDGIETPRFFGEHANTDPDSARTTVWCTPVFSAALTAHLRAAITDTVPATGGEIEVLRGELREWPSSGYFVNPTSGEVISYSGRTEKNASGYAAFTGIKRARYGTTAASASANDTLYIVERKIELIHGHTGIAAPEPRLDVKPMLDLTSNTLSNIRHEWINFYDDLYPARPAQWARSFEPRDGGTQFIYLPTAPSAPAANLDFSYIYRSPAVDKDNYNVVWRPIPTGTKGASGQVAFTRAVDSTMEIQLLGKLADGMEVVLDHFRGTLASGSYSSAWTNKAMALGLYAKSQVMLSTPEIQDNALTDISAAAIYTDQVHAANTAGFKSQIIVNESDDIYIVRKIAVLVWQDGTPNDAISLRVLNDDGSGAPGTLVFANVFFTPPTSAAWSTITLQYPIPILPGGAIHVQVNNIADSTISRSLWTYQPIRYQDAYPMYGVRLLGDGPISADARGEGGSTAGGVAPDNATVDGISIDLDTAGVPYFALKAEQACYWLNGKLTNTTTLQAIQFGLFVSPNDVIEVDVGARTVRNLTTGENGLLYGLTPTDAETWLSLVPGDNVLQWDETGVQRVDIGVDYFDRWE